MFELGLSHEELPGGVVLVKVVGELDVYTFPKFREYLREFLEREVLPRYVGLELSEIDFWDSTALGVAVGFLKQCRQATPPIGVVIVAPSERVGKIFRITGLTKVFPIFESTEALLERVRGEDKPASEGDAGEELCA
ncbi:anti-sigma factor antagonist [Streptomyces sp. WAC 06738]|uniref:anti-sigma factor antagonist n=1 Tax=Streptomyces sp. WAC 06738 TaxID=2203210 RepID=UPI000F715404|nr:anti-sigma factor antagonist [Streptomyces sp. WAC 06738]AZM50878.1 anti-sigma factor antagonist [Streptomyces sp. WAC 06738]